MSIVKTAGSVSVRDPQTGKKAFVETFGTKDRLLVEDINSVANPGSGTGLGSWNSKLRYIDIIPSNGGLARGTQIIDNDVWVSIISVTNSGMFSGFSLALGSADSKWNLRLVIDGEEILNNATDGLLSEDIKNIYDFGSTTQNQATSGFNLSVDAGGLKMSAPLSSPINYTTSVEVLLMRKSGAGNKNFDGGIITLSKDT